MELSPDSPDIGTRYDIPKVTLSDSQPDHVTCNSKSHFAADELYFVCERLYLKNSGRMSSKGFFPNLKQGEIMKHGKQEAVF